VKGCRALEGASAAQEEALAWFGLDGGGMVTAGGSGLSSS